MRYFIIMESLIKYYPTIQRFLSLCITLCMSNLLCFIAVMEGLGNAGILRNWISLEKREGRGRGGEGGGERVALRPLRIVSTYMFCVHISGWTVPKLYSVDNSGM